MKPSFLRKFLCVLLNNKIYDYREDYHILSKYILFYFHLGPLIYVHNSIQTSKSKNQLINVMAQYQQ